MLSEGSNLASKTRLLLLVLLLFLILVVVLILFSALLLLFVTLKIVAVLVEEAVANPVTTVVREFDTKLALLICPDHLIVKSQMKV